MILTDHEIQGAILEVANQVVKEKGSVKGAIFTLLEKTRDWGVDTKDIVRNCSILEARGLVKLEGVRMVDNKQSPVIRITAKGIEQYEENHRARSGRTASSDSDRRATPQDSMVQGIRHLMTELDHILRHFTKGKKLDLALVRLDRWKERATEYLNENVSAREAYEFSKIRTKAVASAWNTTKEIENYMAYLQVFCEDRESRAQLTSTRQTGSEIREESNVNDVSLNFLHPRLIEKCADHFRNKKFDEVILNACKVVEVYTRERANLRASDIGVPLMRKVFRPNPPILKYSDDKGEQEALMHLFSGFIGVFKNPQSHRFVNVKDPLVAFEILVFADRLCKILEQTQFQIPDLGSQSTTNKSGSDR